MSVWTLPTSGLPPLYIVPPATTSPSSVRKVSPGFFAASSKALSSPRAMYTPSRRTSSAGSKKSGALTMPLAGLAPSIFAGSAFFSSPSSYFRKSDCPSSSPFRCSIAFLMAPSSSAMSAYAHGPRKPTTARSHGSSIFSPCMSIPPRPPFVGSSRMSPAVACMTPQRSASSLVAMSSEVTRRACSSPAARIAVRSSSTRPAADRHSASSLDTVSRSESLAATKSTTSAASDSFSVRRRSTSSSLVRILSSAAETPPF